MTKTAENHTLWGRTYLYSPYKGVHPPPGGGLIFQAFALRDTKMTAREGCRVRRVGQEMTYRFSFCLL